MKIRTPREGIPVGSTNEAPLAKLVATVMDVERMFDGKPPASGITPQDEALGVMAIHHIQASAHKPKPDLEDVSGTNFQDDPSSSEQSKPVIANVLDRIATRYSGLPKEAKFFEDNPELREAMLSSERSTRKEPRKPPPPPHVEPKKGPTNWDQRPWLGMGKKPKPKDA